MGSPAKPFECTAPSCGMRFTNEDHLTVHSRKHDLELQLALGNKTGAFPADQTPTPTRFIRNCEEVGLFQDLQNVNPFDEGFKRAMETNKSSLLASLDSAIALATSDDALHTPHVFPNHTDVAETNMFNSTTKTITRSSSDESTTVIESTVETKLTNEVTIKEQEDPNNMIKVQSNIEIRKADCSTIIASNDPKMIKLIVKSNDKGVNVVKKDVLLTEAGKAPVMSQKSLDFAIDSLTSHSDFVREIKNQDLIDTMKKNMRSALKKTNEDLELTRRGKRKRSEVGDVKSDNYEVMLKLPTGELVHMKSEKAKEPTDAKQRLKEAIEGKIKTEIENKIRTDVENKINTELQEGKFSIKVKDIYSINSSVTPVCSTDQRVLVKISPQQYSEDLIVKIPETPTAFPFLTTNVLIPVNKIAIPAFKVPLPNREKITKSLARNKMIKTIKKQQSFATIHHKTDCDILQKLGGVCNLECAETNPKNAKNLNNIESSNTQVTEKSNCDETSIKFHDLSQNVKIENDFNDQLDKSCKDETNFVLVTPEPCKINSECILGSMGTSQMVNTNNATLVDKNVIKISTKNRHDSSEAYQNSSKSEEDFKKESRQFAVRRYRSKQREKMNSLVQKNSDHQTEIHRLKNELTKTRSELATLKKIFIEHSTECDAAERLRIRCGKLLEIGNET